MLGTVKRVFLGVSPKWLMRPAAFLVHKGRLVRCRADALLFPRKMRYLCPCCGTRLRSFNAGTFTVRPGRFDQRRYEGVRQDVLCPVCRSLPRHRILALWCEKHVGLLRSADVLYFAPEHAMMRWIRHNGVSCVTADLYGAADLRLDIQETGLSDESWDVVFCNHVLEHVDNFRVALAKVRRILRPGGSLVCSFPMDPGVELVDEDPAVHTPEERLRRFGQNDHLRVFGMRAGELLLEEAGFFVEEIRGKDCPEEILPVVGPADYNANVLFRCVKGVSARVSRVE